MRPVGSPARLARKIAIRNPELPQLLETSFTRRVIPRKLLPAETLHRRFVFAVLDAGLASPALFSSAAPLTRGPRLAARELRSLINGSQILAAAIRFSGLQAVIALALKIALFELKAENDIVAEIGKAI